MSMQTKAVTGIIAILFVALGLTLPSVVNSQGLPTPTPTPNPYPLLFVENDCFPPCWFGLTPGISRVEDAETVLANQPELFWDLQTNGNYDLYTNLLISGSYEFFLGQWPRSQPVIYSEINIQNSVVHSIEIAVNTSITLGQVLEVFGMPSQIQLTMQGCWTPYLELFYHEYLLEIDFVIPESFSDFCPDACDTSSIRKDFIVGTLEYYSPTSAQELISGFGMPTQATFGYYFINDRDVPLETWNMWLNNEIDMTCKEAWEQLPEPILDIATPTPSPTQLAE